MIRANHLSFSLAFAVLVVLGVPEQVLAAGTVATEPTAEAKPSLRVVEIPVEGMTCISCAARVKSAVKALSGVVSVEVSLEKRSASVTYFGDGHVPEQIVAAIDKLG